MSEQALLDALLRKPYQIFLGRPTGEPMTCPYCQTPVETHPAARCLDALIAERIFGYVWVQPPKYDARGPLPNQGKALVSPTLAAMHERGEYHWPHLGEVHQFFGLREKYSEDNNAAHQIIDRMSTTTVERWDVEFLSTGVTAKFSYDGGRKLPWVPGDYENWDEHFALAVSRVAVLATRGPA